MSGGAPALLNALSDWRHDTIGALSHEVVRFATVVAQSFSVMLLSFAITQLGMAQLQGFLLAAYTPRGLVSSGW